MYLSYRIKSTCFTAYKCWKDYICDTHERRDICICVHNSTRNNTTTCSEHASLQIESNIFLTA